MIEPGDKPCFTVTELVFDVPLAEEFCILFNFGVVTIHLQNPNASADLIDSTAVHALGQGFEVPISTATRLDRCLVVITHILPKNALKLASGPKTLPCGRRLEAWRDKDLNLPLQPSVLHCSLLTLSHRLQHLT